MAVPSRPSAESSRALGAGLTFAVTVALFAWAGTWLDRKLSSTPWCVLACTLLGVFGGGLHLIVELAPGTFGIGRRQSAEKDRLDPNSPASPPTGPKPPSSAS